MFIWALHNNARWNKKFLPRRPPGSRAPTLAMLGQRAILKHDGGKMEEPWRQFIWTCKRARAFSGDLGTYMTYNLSLKLLDFHTFP